jgi:hypothetical protein
MKKHSFFISLALMIALVCFQSNAFSQSKLRVSVLTCAAGDETYSIWGHTAVRIIDSANQQDIVYNFGTFDFEEPNFVPKFVKGSLLYFISAAPFQQFMYEYQYFKRDIDEQVLNLTEAEKTNWRNALSENMIGNNRYYLYNFIYDNCTTRIKDGLFKNTNYQPRDIAVKSYRPYIVEACYNTGNVWTGFGIDLLLGSESDKAPNTQQQGFLPPLLFHSIAAIPNLVVETKHYTLSNRELVVINTNAVFYTLLISLLLYIFISNWNTLITNRISKIIDIFLLILLGIGGSLVLYMSEFSLHSACHENYNLIWLNPLYLVLLPLYFKHHKALQYIGIFLFIITCLFMLISYWIPQSFSKEVMVLMAVALWVQIRMIHRSKILALNK